MKKYMKIVLFSSLIGITLASVFFFSIKEKANAKNKPTLYVFQVGAFKNEENARNLKRKYPVSRIIKDKNLFRVFIGTSSSKKEILEHWFKEKEYNYYLKEIDVAEDTLKTIQKFDELLINTSDELKDRVIENMLESLPSEL